MVIWENIIKKEIEEDISKRKEKKENEIWVSDLISCKKKVEFYRKFPEMFIIEPKLYIGKFIHTGIQEVLKEIYENVEIEKEVEKEIDGKIIKGRVDAILDDTILEIKYTSNTNLKEPYPHHIIQLKIYLWLTQKNKGKLIYITPNNLLEFDVDGEFKDEDIIELIKNEKSPMWDWECCYCPFKPLCSQKP